MLGTGFFQAKIIKRPTKSENLAEVFGALMGDGGITRRQVRVTLNSVTDADYIRHLQRLLKNLFVIKVVVVPRKGRAIDLLMSSRKLVVFLQNRGLIVGDKLKHGLDIPNWINERRVWQKACIRGLFDTDGCTYIDKHVIKGKIYLNLGLSFTSYSPRLLLSYASILKSLSFSPTVTTKKRVILRKEKEIFRFFSEIVPSNPRHWKVYNKFVVGCRSGQTG